jgi:hypothetical protein
MSNPFQCGDNTALVSYLYDECQPDERAVISAHVGVCAACAAEIAALASARQQLSSWAPPDTDLGFAIVRPQASRLRTQSRAHTQPSDGPASRGSRPGPWFSRPIPAWAQAAAACLIFGAGLSLGVLRGMTPGGPPAQARAAATVPSAPTVTATDLASLEQRLRAEMADLRTLSVSTPASAPRSGSNAELLAQVRALIDESEQRQQRELALRTAQVVRDFDSQRRVDLAQIQRNFGQIEGLTGAEVREQRQMLNYLMRVSEQR